MPEPKVKITVIHAFLALENGEEGIAAWWNEEFGGWLPLVSGYPGQFELLKVIAQRVADRTGQPIEIVRFFQREHVGVINPNREKTNED